MSANMRADRSARLGYGSCSNLAETRQCFTVTKPKAVHQGKTHSQLFADAFRAGTRAAGTTPPGSTGGGTGETVVSRDFQELGRSRGRRLGAAFLSRISAGTLREGQVVLGVAVRRAFLDMAVLPPRLRSPHAGSVSLEENPPQDGVRRASPHGASPLQRQPGTSTPSPLGPARAVSAGRTEEGGPVDALAFVPRGFLPSPFPSCLSSPVWMAARLSVPRDLFQVPDVGSLCSVSGQSALGHVVHPLPPFPEGPPPHAHTRNHIHTCTRLHCAHAHTLSTGAHDR